MNITKNDIRIFLHKPNRDNLGEISIFNRPKHNPKLGRHNQLTFSLPYYIFEESQGEDLTKKKKANNIFHTIRERYLLKVQWLGKTEWYIVDDINKQGSINGNSKEITAYSLPYEMRGERLFDWDGVLVDGEYRKESLKIDQITNNVIRNTAWQIDYIDPELLTLHRFFDFTDNTTVLEALYEIAETFKAIIEWDTENRKLSFYREGEYGADKRILLSYKRYLKTIQDEVKPNEIITRLIPVGKDGMRINSLNPTGSPYLQDFSYFMQPFERDSESNVIHSSYWFSDSLCHALLDYNELTESKQIEYESLLSERDFFIDELITKESEAFHLGTDLQIVRDTIDVKQSQGEDVSAELTEEAQLEFQIEELQADISLIENDLDDNLTNLTEITDLLSFQNNFTKEQLDELSSLINTEIWQNDYIDNEEDLLDAAKEHFSTINHPKTNLKISLVDLLDMVEVDEDVKSLWLGDRININYEIFNANVQSQIVEMDIDYEQGSISTVIGNTHKIFENADDEIAEMIYKNASVAGQVLREKAKWNKVTGVENTVENFLNSVFDATLQTINSGVNNSTVLNARGITSTNSNNPLNFLRMNNGVIGITKDGGNSLGVAINGEGIFADLLVGRIIAGVNLLIENESGTYTMNDDGFMITRNDGLVRISLDSNSGIKIQKNIDVVNDAWEDQLSVDVNGDAFFNGVVRVGSETNYDTGYDPSTKETPTGAQSKVNELANSLGDLAYDDLVEQAKLGSTIIQGGYIKSELLTADNILAGFLSFNRARGGTLTLGGSGNGNGKLEVLNSSGNIIADLDAQYGGFSTLNVGTLNVTGKINNSDMIIPMRSGVTLNVSSSGNDNNSGTTTNPLATIEEAVSRISKILDANATIRLQSNITESFVRIEGFSGSGWIGLDLNGNTLNGGLTIGNNAVRVEAYNGKINYTGGNSHCVYISASQYVYFDNVVTNGNGHDSAILIWRGSNVELRRCEMYNVVRCIYITRMSHVYILDCKGLGSSRGIDCITGSIVTGSGTAPMGEISNLRITDSSITENSWTFDSGSATPPPPEVTEVTSEWTASSSKSWRDNWGWRTDNNNVYQGEWNGYGLHKGLWFFGDNVRNAVNGKTIKRIRIWINRLNEGGNSGDVGIVIRSHNHSSQPSGEPSLSSTTSTVNFKRGESKWVQLPSTFHSIFSGGSARGIGIYTTSRHNDNYAICNTNAKIEITYEN